MQKKLTTIEQPRQRATSAHKNEILAAIAEINSRRAALAAERASIDAEDHDLAFLQSVLEGDVQLIDGHLNGGQNGISSD